MCHEITKIIENYGKSPKNLPKSLLNVPKSPAHFVDIFLLGLKMKKKRIQVPLYISTYSLMKS